MINLMKKSLPNTIQVGGRDFAIYTDFRTWMRFVTEFESWSANGCRGVLGLEYLFKNELPAFECIKDYDGIFEFAFPRNVIPKGRGSGESVLYFQFDGDYIFSAFMEQYSVDLIEVEDLHWHKFSAMLNGLNNTKLNEIMEYRSYTGEKVKDMDSQYRRMKEIWTPPIELTEEEKEEEEKFNNYFG